MNIITTIAQIASCITAVSAALVVFIKPIRNKVFKEKKEDDSQKEGLKCLLRTEILKIYYKNRDKQEIDQYEAENFMHLCNSYFALGGNSFVTEIYQHVITWKVVK